MAKSNGSSSVSLPWLLANEPELDRVISISVDELVKQQSQKPSTKLSDKDKGKLQRKFRHAEQSRGSSLKAMTALAEAIGVIYNKDNVYMGPMKDWDRAAEKMGAEGRNLHDLGRGRILVDNPKQIAAFYKILKQKDREGYLQAFRSEKVRILEGSFNDYLESPRCSGYAGSINFDLEVALGKNRFGRVEVQIMPKDYVDTYDLSHNLFKIIRTLQEVPEAWRTETHNRVLQTLIRANGAFFDESAERYGFMELRKQKYEPISEQDLREINNILDRFRTKIEKLPGRRYKWMNDTMGALSYAKTSALNLWSSNPAIGASAHPDLT